MSYERWRLLQSHPQSGHVNMAVDEALLESVGAEESPPTLRLYSWDPPTLSLGFTQPVAEVDRAALQRQGWDLARRPTGGRAILHTDELTYSVTAPHDHPLVQGGVMASYQRLSAALQAALEALGLKPEIRRGQQPDEAARANPVCFEVPSAYELTVRGKKLIGSAQVRRREGVLQHGTVPLTGDIGRICVGLAFAHEGDRQTAADRVRAGAATVSELLARPVSWEEAAAAMETGFQEALDLKLDLGDLTEGERARADALAREKHGKRSWIERL